LQGWEKINFPLVRLCFIGELGLLLGAFSIVVNHGHTLLVKFENTDKNRDGTILVNYLELASGVIRGGGTKTIEI
jgi:hypothetical protein